MINLTEGVLALLPFVVAILAAPAYDRARDDQRKRESMAIEKARQEEMKILFENPEDPPHLRRCRKG